MKAFLGLFFIVAFFLFGFFVGCVCSHKRECGPCPCPTECKCVGCTCCEACPGEKKCCEGCCK